MNDKSSIIFYTDDDQDDQDLFILAAHQVSASLQVITQSNGEQIMQLLHNPPPVPGMIFLDLNMPVKNGYDILKEIRESSGHLKNLPVIIFSTSDDANAISTARQLGANLYIIKPSSYTSLKNVIAYSLTIDWKTFVPSADNFVYQSN